MNDRTKRAAAYSRQCARKRRYEDRLRTAYVQRLFACSCILLVAALAAAVIVLK